MALGEQIIWGSVFMGLCLMLETGFLVWASTVLSRAGRRLSTPPTTLQIGWMMILALFFIVLAHTIQVLIWSTIWTRYGAVSDWNEAIYFSLVTYTTVGYGDLTLGPGLRVFGTFAGVAGVLGFGISSAFLIAVMSRLLQAGMFGQD
ncbi:ion channel [Jhaorihella thermophila]|uniref:Ion channel n=1 Tax=Jhaorihella thermophila TaxID=488547 RepID=A0A1H5SI04_9RHOB|nr:ion channel [Jhaorihella thermophila]SEF50080.1 Ion channel [Jhaorihella thermophila]